MAGDPSRDYGAAMSDANPSTANLCTYEVLDGVATIGFNRPDNMNGMTGNMELEYFDLLSSAQSDPDVRVIVLTGHGRAFCAGADLANDRSEGDEPLPNTKVPTTTPLGITKPMVAAVNGACAGVGFAYALQCDVRFAAEGAKFTTAFSRRGLIGEYGMPWLLSQIAGRAVALDLLISARVFLAEEAAQLGLVNRVLPRDDVLAAAQAYATDVAANVSPASAATIKQQVSDQALMSGPDAMAHSDGLMAESLEGPDVAEGISSFLERRPVAFPPLGRGTRYAWMGDAG